MGWGRWLLLGDLGQQMDLADQRAEIESLRQELQSRHSTPTSAEQRMEELQRDNDELKLYLAATLRILTAKRLTTPDEIKAMVAAVDREDAAEDQRYSGPLAPSSK